MNTFPFQPSAGSTDPRGPGTMYRDENDDIWVVLADSSVVQVGAGGGSQPIPMTLWFPNEEAPVTGIAVVSGNAVMFVADRGDHALVALGEVNDEQTYFVYGVVMDGYYNLYGVSDETTGPIRFGSNDGFVTGPGAVASFGFAAASLGAGTLDASGLPTSDPASAGQVWNNLGILTVSAG